MFLSLNGRNFFFPLICDGLPIFYHYLTYKGTEKSKMVTKKNFITAFSMQSQDYYTKTKEKTKSYRIIQTHNSATMPQQTNGKPSKH